METQINTKQEIEENLKAVEEGKPLLKSLIILNGEFKEEYRKRFGEFEKLDEQERKNYGRDYRKTLKYKEYEKQRQQEPKNKEIRRKYILNRRRNDYSFRIYCSLRNRIRTALKFNYSRKKILKFPKKYGIDFKKIIEFLKPFPKDISKYHIHHIKPLCSFKFINKDGTINLKSIKKAFAPKNHQWLLAEENLKKGRKYENSNFIFKIFKKIYKFFFGRTL